jgi:hypothetical protein
VVVAPEVSRRPGAGVSVIARRRGRGKGRRYPASAERRTA